MRGQQVQGLLLLLGIIFSALIYHAWTSEPPDPRIQKAQLVYQTELIAVKRENLQRNERLKFYGIIGGLSAVGGSLLIVAGGYARAKVKAASVYMAKIGEYSAIPVHVRDLRRLYPVAANLSLAEIEASVSTSHEKAYRISRQIIEDTVQYTYAISTKRQALNQAFEEQVPSSVEGPTWAAVPTFAELLRTGAIAPGKPLIMGFSQGTPQLRSLHDLKTVAIAGWQGSGKTVSTAYIVASSILAYGVQVYVVDPHKHHEESLSSLIQPLEGTGHVTVMNPFDTPSLIRDLHRVLDRRLAGEEASSPGILLVIDELARLAKTESFNELLTFLERCTEETRKANITFLGGSPKWTARHFKGRADIRGCMNSMLIHKTKPSQADLLLEDARDKHLVKQLHHPGDAILVTDYDIPTLVSMPLCSCKDMEMVAALVDQTSGDRFAGEDLFVSSEREPSGGQHDLPFKDVIPFAPHKKPSADPPPMPHEPSQLTVEIIERQLAYLSCQKHGLTQSELAKRAGISPGYVSRILSGQRPLTLAIQRKLYAALFDCGPHDAAVAVG